MNPRKAVHLGIVFDVRSKNVLRIFNPTFEFELDLHHLGEYEEMVRLKKVRHGIKRTANGMSIPDAVRLIDQFNNRK